MKPGNLLVSNETGTTKLADFGIAKAAEQTRITQVGAVLGTAAYLSPEQATGEEAGPGSDIYSLGVCAYQFLAGRLPHEYGSLTELALKQQQERVAPITAYRDDVTPELDQAVRLCLERDPAHRYANALDMAGALEAGLRGDTTAATELMALTDATSKLDSTAATQALPATRAPRRAAPAAERRPVPPRRERPPRKRNPLRAIVLALIVLLAGAAIALALSLSSGNRQDINNGNVHDQVKQLIQYVNKHTQ